MDRQQQRPCRLAFWTTLLLVGLSMSMRQTQALGPFKKLMTFDTLPLTGKNDTGNPLFLSPLIKAKNISYAQKSASVTYPPMAKIVESYSGYLTVNSASCQSNMFFWYFPAAFNSAKAPVVLWLQGGPGGTSLFGLFTENGPFRVTKDMKLIPRKTSWSLTTNVIYIDNPVGTGYSFTKNCYAKNESDVGRDLYDALLQFFQLFPQLQQNDFYVTGESYAGKYVPAIAYKIHKENPKAAQKINLKGMAIGDGLCDPETMQGYGPVLYNIGLIDEEDRDYFSKVEKITKALIQKKKFIEAFQVFDDLLNGDLSGHPSYFANATGFHYYFNYLMSEQPADMGYFNTFVQQSTSRKAMHVGNMTYNDGQLVEKNLMADVMDSVKPWIQELLEEKYKVLIYSGQLDVIIAWPLTDSFVTSMKWSGAKKFLQAPRQKWHVGGQLAGYFKTVGNFTQLLVRNAGHMVPYDQPKMAFDLINRFVGGKPFN